MNPMSARSVLVRGNDGASPRSTLQRLVHKSILLNAVVVLTSFPVLVLAGGPRAVVPTLAIMAGITLIIWTSTFALYSCFSIGRLLWTLVSEGTARKPREPAGRVGIADRWLDGPG